MVPALVEIAQDVQALCPEAWFFHVGKLHDTGEAALGEFGGRDLELEGVRVIAVREYTNFRLLDVRITALDRQSGQSVEVTGDQGGTVVECRGLYKFFLYRI